MFGLFELIKVKTVIIIMITVIKLVACCVHYDDPSCREVDLSKGKYFTNKFIVQLRDGGEDDAKRIAQEEGFTYIQPIAEFDKYYFFRNNDTPDKHRMKQDNVLERLKSHGKVRTADQEYIFQSTLEEMNKANGMVGREDPRPAEIEDLNPDAVQLGKDFQKDNIFQNNFQRKEQSLPPLRKVWPEFKERTMYKNEI